MTAPRTLNTTSSYSDTDLVRRTIALADRHIAALEAFRLKSVGSLMRRISGNAQDGTKNPHEGVAWNALPKSNMENNVSVTTLDRELAMMHRSPSASSSGSSTSASSIFSASSASSAIATPPRVHLRGSTPSLLSPSPPPTPTVVSLAAPWITATSVPCLASVSAFWKGMMELVRTPEVGNPCVLRGDVLFDSATDVTATSTIEPRTLSIPGFQAAHTLVRRCIPQDLDRDNVAEQTVHFLVPEYGNDTALVLFLNHTTSAASTPGYLPSVTGLAFLLHAAEITTSYLLFPDAPALTPGLIHTASTLTARAATLASSPVDLVAPSDPFQTRYLALRARHADRLCAQWTEPTDPRKHVSEDLQIATYLLLLWETLYPSHQNWIGFVDMGCGNGVLVDILIREGWSGRGFDARARKNWGLFEPATRDKLEESVLVPYLLGGEDEEGMERGRFRSGEFLVSNHADQVSAWMPLLAAARGCRFLCVPCCSHDLAGRKFRAPDVVVGGVSSSGDPQPSRRNPSQRTYAALCGYISRLSTDAGWCIERDVLRIPSVRNVGILGLECAGDENAVREVVEREMGGVGVEGWRENCLCLS